MGGTGRPEIHHHFCYAGKQISEMWNYVPLSNEYHTGEKGVHKCKETHDKISLFILKRMTPADRAKYPKRNWLQEKEYLKHKLLGYETN